jgi:hypothetical protein
VSKATVEPEVVSEDRELIDVPLQGELLGKTDWGESHAAIFQLRS